MKRSLLLTPAHAARALGVSRSKFYQMIQDDKTPRFPRPIEVRGKRMYVVAEIEGFVRECIAERSAK